MRDSVTGFDEMPLYDVPAAPVSIREAASRRRLRAHFLRAGRDAVDDRELLELLLSGRHAADHPETLEPWTPTRGAYYIAGSARATATGGAYKGRDDYLLISLPPAFVGVLDGDGFMWLAVHPINAHRCTVRTGRAFASRGPAGVLDRIREAVGGDDAGAESAHGLLDFVAEDKAICERVQRGVGGDFVPGRLVPMERIVEDFGHYLNWRLNGVEPPA